MSKLKKPIFLALLTIVVIVVPLLINLFFINNQKIRVVSNSKYYHVAYKETEVFNKLLEDWGIWEENKVFKRDLKPYNKIDQIEFRLADRVQAYLMQKDATGNIIWSSDIKVENSNKLVIIIYINPKNMVDPELKNDLEKNIAKLFFAASTVSLYHAISENEFTTSSSPVDRQITDIFKKNVDLPFAMKIIKK